MADKSAENNASVTSARIILLAQGVSVVSSIAGLIGLIIAYRVLTKTGDSSSKNTARIPTIT